MKVNVIVAMRLHKKTKRIRHLALTESVFTMRLVMIFLRKKIIAWRKSLGK